MFSSRSMITWSSVNGSPTPSFSAAAAPCCATHSGIGSRLGCRSVISSSISSSSPAETRSGPASSSVRRAGASGSAARASASPTSSAQSG